MGSSHSKALTLHFETHTRLSGETLHGDVDINLALAQEDKIEQVRVKLFGLVETSITLSDGETSQAYREKVSLFKFNEILWSKDSSVSSPGSLTPRFHFEFKLPLQLPPSFYSIAGSSHGAVKYIVKVVGERPGFFRRNRRITKVFPVVSASLPTDLNNKVLLVSGWNQEWKSFNSERHIREWPWGDYSHVSAEFTIPALPSFPISTPIPFRLLIVTKTKPLKRSEAPTHSTAKQYPFPTPPTSPLRIDLRLARHVHIQAEGQSQSSSRNGAYLGGMRDKSALAKLGDKFKTWSEEPEWIPQPGEKDDKHRGVWQRRVHFESFMEFACPPSFSTPTLGNRYTIKLRIPFPGLHNDLKSENSIAITSGVGLAPQSSSDTSYADVPPPDIPLDLPPRYWSHEDHAWDEDEKS